MISAENAAARLRSVTITHLSSSENMTPPAMSRKRGKGLAIVGVCLSFGLLIGPFGTMAAMMRTISFVESNPTVRPEDLAASMAAAFDSTAIGLLFGLAGLICLLVSLFGFRYRSKGLFWWMIVIGCIWLLACPIGTVFGLLLLLFAILSRNEFLNAGQAAPTAGPN
jgi:hypothetical protein